MLHKMMHILWTPLNLNNINSIALALYKKNIKNTHLPVNEFIAQINWFIILFPKKADEPSLLDAVDNCLMAAEPCHPCKKKRHTLWLISSERRRSIRLSPGCWLGTINTVRSAHNVPIAARFSASRLHILMGAGRGYPVEEPMLLPLQRGFFFLSV